MRTIEEFQEAQNKKEYLSLYNLIKLQFEQFNKERLLICKRVTKTRTDDENGLKIETLLKYSIVNSLSVFGYSNPPKNVEESYFICTKSDYRRLKEYLEVD